MPSEFDALALEAIDIGFEMNGLRADYVPPGGGASVPCLVTRDTRDIDPDAGDGRPRTGQLTLRVRASEVAQPVQRGTFTLSPVDGGTVYQIDNRPQPADPNGFVWTMWVS
jgi:hypothetical protein